MADDPLFGFKPTPHAAPTTVPAQPATPANDPLFGFKPKTAAPAAPAAQTASPEIAQPTDSQAPLDPRTATMGDYLARLHGAVAPLATFASNYGRTAANVYGLYDRMAASAQTSGFQQDPKTGQWVSVNDPNKEAAALAAEKAKTAEASAALAPEARIAASMTGAGPVGALGIGKGVANTAAPYVPKLFGGNWTAGLIGGATEGATLAGTAAAGRGEPVAPAALMGGAGGAAFAAPGGMVNRGRLPATPTADDFDQAAQSVYGDMRKIGYLPSTPTAAYASARSALTPAQEANLSPGFLRLIARQQGNFGRTVSADSINGFARDLQSAASTNADQVLAAKIRDNLNSVLENSTTVTGHAPGVAADLQERANQYIGQREDLNRLEEFQQKADVAGGPDVSSQVGSWLRSAEGQRIAPPGSPQYEAANTLAGTPARPTNYFPSWVRHYVLPGVAGTTIGEGISYLTGDENTPMGRVAEDLAMAALVRGGQGALSSYTGATRGAAQQRAIDALRATIGTGQLQKPLGSPALVRDLFRSLYGQVAPSLPQQISGAKP